MFSPTQRLQPETAILCSTGADLTELEQRHVHMDTEAWGQTEWEASEFLPPNCTQRPTLKYKTSSLTSCIFVLWYLLLSRFLNLYTFFPPYLRQFTIFLNTPFSEPPKIPPPSNLKEKETRVWNRRKHFCTTASHTLFTSSPPFPIHAFCRKVHTVCIFHRTWDLSLLRHSGRWHMWSILQRHIKVVFA